MLKATVSIQGVRPLLWHHFGPDALPLDKKREKTGVAGNDPEEWKKKVLVTKDNQLYLESSYAFGCIRDGAKFTKSGRGSIQTKVSSTLQVLDDIILVDRFLPENIAELVNEKDMPVYLDVRSVRNPATRARNVRYRVTSSPGWKATFQIIWDKTVVSRNEMEGVLRDAGQFCGLGDGRSIGYGRFIVNDFLVEEI